MWMVCTNREQILFPQQHSTFWRITLGSLGLLVLYGVYFFCIRGILSRWVFKYCYWYFVPSLSSFHCFFKSTFLFLSILFLVLDTFPPVCHVTVFLKTGSFQVLFTFFIFVWTSMNWKQKLIKIWTGYSWLFFMRVVQHPVIMDLGTWLEGGERCLPGQKVAM